MPHASHSSRLSTILVSGLGAVLSVALVIAPLGSSPASADPESSESGPVAVTGSVQTVWGDTIYGATVELYGVDDTSPIDTAIVEDQTFTLEAPAPGEYRVKASAVDYETVWWQSASSFADATPIDISDVETTGIDIQLPVRVYSLSGTVTGGEPAVPLEGIGVQVRGIYGGYTEPVLTDADGHYEVTGLPDSGFVQFIGAAGFAGEWFENVPDVESATELSFHEDQTVDAILTPAGSISGTVRGSAKAGGATVPLAEAVVTLYTSTGSYITEVPTDADGRYSFEGLAAGPYRLAFTGPGAVEWKSGFYGDVERMSQSPAVTLADGADLAGIDARLTSPPALSGTIIDKRTGEPVDSARVSLLTLNGTLVDDTYTSEGRYSFLDVPSGAYTVFVYGSIDDARTWFGGSTQSSAAPITITRGVTASGKNITRPAAGRVSGTISAPGVSLLGTQVAVYTSKGEELSRQYASQGSYEFYGILPGTYTLRVIPPAGRLVSEWWNNKKTRQTATRFTVTAGKERMLGAIVLSALKAGSISGHVSGGAGTEVIVEGAGIDEFAPRFATVNESGDYAIGGLAPGAFILTFADGQRYRGKFGGAKGDPVIVIAGRRTVAATVTLRQRVPVDISAITSDGQFANSSLTFFDLAGAYMTDASVSEWGGTQVELPRGQYKVRFDSRNNEKPLGLIWLGDKPDFRSSMVLDLRSAESASISATLPPASSFAAKVVDDAHGRPLDSVAVYTWQLEPDGSYQSLGSSATTGVDGRFTTDKLGSGTYKFQLVDSTYRSYRSTWYGGTSLASAKAVSVAGTPTAATGSLVTRMKAITGTVGVRIPIASGVMKVGRTLTARTSVVWPAKGVTKTYRWYRNGAAIAKATSVTYKLTKADAGKEITVRVTGSRAEFFGSSSLSLPRNTLD